jgi:hypothetical protein
VHGVPNAADTVESKECDPIDLKTDYPEYRLSPLSLNRYGRSTPQVLPFPVHGVPNAVDTVESKESDPIDRKLTTLNTD